MNNIVKSFLVILSIFSMSIALKAQEDSVSVEESIESITQSDFKKKRDYKYLDPRFKEEKTLIKLGTSPLDLISDPSAIEIGELSMKLSWEQKLNPSLSFQIDACFYRVADLDFVNGLNSNIGIRYYYNMRRRIKEKRGANNFHGNYFSLMLEDILRYTEDVYTPYSQLYSRWGVKPGINLAWGIQRRFGKRGFIDVGPYVSFTRDKFGSGINLNIGLAW
jgi:hypothetical protein